MRSLANWTAQATARKRRGEERQPIEAEEKHREPDFRGPDADGQTSQSNGTRLPQGQRHGRNPRSEQNKAAEGNQSADMIRPTKARPAGGVQLPRQ